MGRGEDRGERGRICNHREGQRDRGYIHLNRYMFFLYVSIEQYLVVLLLDMKLHFHPSK